MLTGPAELFGIYRNAHADVRDHVALFVCRDWERKGAFKIAEPRDRRLRAFSARRAARGYEQRHASAAPRGARRRARRLPTGRLRSALRKVGPTEAVAVVRGIDDQKRSKRHDAGRIDAVVAVIIVLLGVLDVDRLLHAGHLVEVAEIA